MDGKENIFKHSYLYDGKRKTSSRCRKVNKPLVEKKRRARINGALSQLKALVLDSGRNEKTVFSKLEKADILEMTLKRLIQLQNISVSNQKHQTNVPSKYQTGFYECAVEAIRYLGEHLEEGNELKTKLVTHLATCIVTSNSTDDKALQSATGSLKQSNEETEIIHEGMENSQDINVHSERRELDNTCESFNDHLDADNRKLVDVTSEHAQFVNGANRWNDVDTVDQACGTLMTSSDAENRKRLDVTSAHAYSNQCTEGNTTFCETFMASSNDEHRTQDRVSSAYAPEPNISNTLLHADEHITLPYPTSENIPNQVQPRYCHARTIDHNEFVTETHNPYPFRNVEEDNAWLDAYKINSHNVDTANFSHHDGYQMANSLNINSNVQCELSRGIRTPQTSYLFEQIDRRCTNLHADTSMNADRRCTGIHALVETSTTINKQIQSDFGHGVSKTSLNIGLEAAHGQQLQEDHYSLFGQGITRVWRPW